MRHDQNRFEIMKIVNKANVLIISLYFSIFGCSIRSMINAFAIKDVNIFIENSESQYFDQKSFFLEISKVRALKLGMTEENIYKVLGTMNFKTRHSFNQTLAKKLMKGKYIPVSKTISFSGFRTTISVGRGYTKRVPQEKIGVSFFLYKNRLIHITIIHWEKKEHDWVLLPDSTEEVLYVSNHSDTDEPLNFTKTNGGGDEKFYGFVNGYLGERFTKSGERYFVPLVPLSKHLAIDFLSDYCKTKYYWEEQNYESELQKSGYYKIKEMYDQDFENHNGYWSEEAIK